MAFDRRIIEARLGLDLIGSSDMPKIAWDALEAGLDGPAIRRLAALNSPTYFEVRDVLPEALREMGLAGLSRAEAAFRIAKDLAQEILASGKDPLKLKHHFWQLWIKSGYARELQSVGNLADETYLASTIGGHSEDKIREWMNDRLEEFLDERI